MELHNFISKTLIQLLQLEHQQRLTTNKFCMKQEQATEAKPLTITGYIGKDPSFKTLEGDRSVLNFSIMPSGKNTENEWTKVVAWNENAIRIRDGILDEGIKKVQLIGNMKQPPPYESQGAMAESKPEFVVSEIKYLAKSIELSGVIGSVQEKGSDANKHTHLFILNNVSDTQVDKFNVMIFNDQKAKIPASVELEKGKPIAVFGEHRTERYLDQNTKSIKESVTIVARHIERTPTKLRELMNSHKEKDHSPVM